jgi:hypothetical protein
LTRPFGAHALFVPTGGNEAQLVFKLPADARGVRLLVRADTGPIDLPVGAAFHVRWPAPVVTIADGAAMRVHVLPSPVPPAWLPAAASGRTYRLLDVVTESLRAAPRLEFQAAQLRIQMADGSLVEPSPLSSDMPCRLSEDGVIPPRTVRRFTLVYDVPAGGPPRRLQYRGFELPEAIVNLP